MGIPVFFASHIPFQGSRSETEFIGFAGRRARTEPEFGLLFRLFPFQGSRSKTEFIGLAGSKAPTGKPARSESGKEKELPPQLFSSR